MGLTQITASVSDLNKSNPPFESLFLVNTGAVDCMVPSDKLMEAGIPVEEKNVYELANGEVVEYEYGFARISFMGSETVTQVTFGPQNTEPILGVVALENTGYGVDPVTKSLKKIAAKSLK